MRVTGIAGLVRVLVDARERVAAVQFLPDSASAAMREESRRVTAEWNLVRAGTTDPADVSGSTSTVTRWRSIDGKWGAVIRSSNRGTRPTILHLSDATALSELVSSAPLASLVLALNQLAESADLGNVDDVSEVLGTIVYGRAADRANETPAPTVALVLPLCEPERSDPIVAAPPGSDDRYSAPAMALLEHAVSNLYSGSRLTLGDGAWIVDRTGRSEQLESDAFRPTIERALMTLIAQFAYMSPRADGPVNSVGYVLNDSRTQAVLDAVTESHDSDDLLRGLLADG